MTFYSYERLMALPTGRAIYVTGFGLAEEGIRCARVSRREIIDATMYSRSFPTVRDSFHLDNGHRCIRP